MPPKASSPLTPKPPRIARTNAEKIAIADHKRALAQKKANRPASKKRRTLPPPDEMEAAITDKERAKEAQVLAAARKIATRKNKSLTNADKIAEAKKKAAEVRKQNAKKEGKGSGPKTLKEIVAEELGFRSEPAKLTKTLGGGKKAKIEKKKKKAKSCFSMVMEQDGGSPTSGAFLGVGRTLEDSVEESAGGEEDGDAHGLARDDKCGELDDDADGEESGGESRDNELE